MSYLEATKTMTATAESLTSFFGESFVKQGRKITGIGRTFTWSEAKNLLYSTMRGAYFAGLSAEEIDARRRAGGGYRTSVEYYYGK
ncbi:hypothetical protein GWN42_31460 [candidate division KSB1 bacterium]|nr:hypothetical protein [Phycisphaerae bacterium]NIQ92574.1 hypothetical protein [Deltaproteobacteria bacterium]NIV97187.1 hypothetical protein [candidate division KSB1 bacterium]